MRVLHLATTYPLHDGDSNAAFVAAIAEGLAARGHDIDVLVPWHPELELERPGSGVRLRAFRYSPTRHWHPWGYAQALRGDRELRRDAYLAAGPAALAAWWQIRRSRHRYDLLHAHWLVPNAPIVAAARGNSPMVVSCHGSGVFLAERLGWAGRLARWALRSSAAVTACSSDLVRRLQSFGAGPVPVRMPYGVHTDRFRPLEGPARDAVRARLHRQHGVPADAPLVLAVGRLVYKKGFDVLIEALPALAARVPGAHVVIVGEGPLAGELEQRARANGAADRLHLIGPAPHVELPCYYGAADVVAVPSVHGPAGNVDGLPNTLLEALASGSPVVASRVAGIPDVLRHDDNGLLFPEADAGALAGVLAQLLSDVAARHRIGSAARADAEANLGWDRVAARFEKLYEAAVAGGC